MNRPEIGMNHDLSDEKSEPIVIDVANEEDENEVEEVIREEAGSEAVSDAEEAGDAFVESGGVEIASQAEISEIGQEEDPLLFVQLGDRILVDSIKYHGRTIGTVYYRSLERIGIKPDGISDSLRWFDLEQTDEEERYREEDGVQAIYILEKRKMESFVEQQDFRVKQIVDALDNDSQLVGSYRIVAVDKDRDAIRIQSVEDAEEERELVFDYVGIPPEEGIALLSLRSAVPEEDPSQANEAQMAERGDGVNADDGKYDVDVENENENENDGVVNEEQRKLDDIQLLGKVQIARPMMYREAASYEQRIPDALQKVDALNDFIHSLDPSLQKDPHALRRIRMLVETLYLLNKETIEYDVEGNVAGPKKVSLETIAELIGTTALPMGRPVLSITKKLYVAADDEEKESPSIEREDREAGEEIYLKSFEKELEEMGSMKTGVVSSAGLAQKGTSAEWLKLQLFAKRFRPWVSHPQQPPQWIAWEDAEFFRSAPPSTEEVSEGVHELLPMVDGYMASHRAENPPILDTIPFGMERALSRTYRKGADMKKTSFLAPDSAPMESFLLFPQRTIPYLGKKRTYHLAMDSGRSHLPLKTMRDILEESGEPIEIGSTSRDIILLKATGDSLGNIPLHDYVEGLSIPSLGWGDVFSTLLHYGLDAFELHPALARVLQKKMTLYQSQLKSALATLRTSLAAEPKKATASTVLLPDTQLWDIVGTQDVLVRALEEYQKRNPTMADSDIGKVIHLTKYHDNYFQVAAGKTPLLIAKAVRAAYNQEYLDAIQVQHRIRQREKEAGERPKKNACPHVADMVSVRRITEDAERFFQLTKVFKRYQGERKDNWFHCNLCKEHLLCIHERLQLQGYLHPKEKDTLEKEILLKCSGGQFQGKYICRNCGQSIRELEFDNHMEFDDDGKPISGRAVLVDKDALFEEKMEDLISAPVESEDAKQKEWTEEERMCYQIIRVIAEKVGVYPTEERYQKMIQRALQMIHRLATRAQYAKMAGAKLDYDVYHARHLISYCSLCLLLDVQTKYPPYIIRYKLHGCKSQGFDGYPLDTDPAKKEGVEYIACAVASIHRKDSPWRETGFSREKDDIKRMNAVVYYMMASLPKMLDDPMIQAELAEKRRYLADVMGMISSNETSGPTDMVFPSFLPELHSPPLSEAIQNAMTPEIVERMGVRGRSALARLWIRQAHQYATETAAIVHGSPRLEITCCISSLLTPQASWKQASSLPPMEPRTWTPHLQGQALVTHFVPRTQETSVATTNPELYYRIFLRYCFTGPRIGHSHEPNLLHRCIHCGFQFPTHPSIMNAEKEGKPALVSQEVRMDAVEFNQLLDTIHTVHQVPPFSQAPLTQFMERMTDFASLNPPPIANWETLMDETLDAFQRLNHSASPENLRADLLLAVGPLSDAALEYEEQIRLRLPPKTATVLKQIADLPWNAFFEVLQTYFITFFQRVLSGYRKDALFLPMELSHALSDQHKDLLKGVLENHIKDVAKWSVVWENEAHYDVARSKLDYYLQQMSEILPYKDRIRPLSVPGQQFTLSYFQRVLLYGPLGTMLSSFHLPESAKGKSAIREIGNPSIQYLLGLIQTSLDKYQRERLSFNDQEIKNRMAIRDEKERVMVVKEFDKLTDEERAVELMNKRLGLGKWAVGGSKLIYAYDKDYFDLEREKRIAAGIIDFPGMSTGELPVPEGREHDEYGFPVYHDEEFEREGGYDVQQHGEDD